MMAQWAHLGRARVPFHLYVPVGCVDMARRLAVENHVNIAELWSFHTIGDQTRFTLVQRSAAAEAKPPAEPVRAATRPAKAAVKRTARTPAARKTATPRAKAAVRKPAQKRK